MIFVPNNRNPDEKFNASGYFDETAYNAICNIDKEELTMRRRRVMLRFMEIAAEEGLKIASYVKLVEADSNGKQEND